MPTDKARNSYDAGRQYRSVVAQQGRVSVEADANEAEEIRAAESRAELIDIIGPSGTPDEGFQISVPTGGVPYGFTIGSGTIYVGGLRVYLESAETYDGQKRHEWADRAVPDPDARSTPGTEIVYLELAEQEISAVEDPALLEVALGGPDTAGRTRLVRHVRRAAMTAGAECERGLLDALATRTPGLVHDATTMELRSKAKLKVSTVPVPDSANACQPIAKSGFLGPENQLIRIQVASTGELLWGYDNASFMYRVKPLTAPGKVLELVGHPVDESHRLRQHQWVEVLHTAVDLGDGALIATAVGEPYEVDNYDTSANTLTLATTLTNITGPLFVRVWQGRVPFGGGPQNLTDSLGAGIGLRVEASGPATSGDFWMVGVRPTHPDKLYPRRFETAQPPDGPHRWATPLATIAWTTNGTSAVVHDCRRPFKPRTEDDDLAFHNQHLHGWGVVCGMQVHCMELAYAAAHNYDPHEWLTVQNGYAIDPTGIDLRLSSRAPDRLTPVNIADLADLEGGLKRVNGKVPDGSVSLWLDRHLRLRAEPYTPKTGKYNWQRLWQDLQNAPPGESMLADIYRDCVLRIIDYIRALVPESKDPKVTFAQRLSAVLRGVEVPTPVQGLVGESARRLIAVLNLVWQVNNPKTSRHIYLSGDAGDPMSLWTEDGLLRSFFEDLKQLLQSKTFCAMFADVAYPAYDVYRGAPGNPHPSTIFGTNRHTRIRVHHTEKLAFTCGNGAQINVYDLSTGKILRCVDFPSTGAEVQDVAFSNTGNEVYAIAWVGTQKSESMFAGGVFKQNGEIAWSGRKHLAQLKLVTLVNDPKSTEVYISARGAGVYRFDPCSTTDAALPSGGLVQVGPGFSASGHLVSGTIKLGAVAADVHACVDAKAEQPDTDLPRPWVHDGYTADSLDPQRPLRAVDWSGRIGINFPAPGARFILPVPAFSVSAEVHVHASPITMTLFDASQKPLATITSSADQSKSQTLKLDVSPGNVAYVEFTNGSWEGVVYELCVDGVAPAGWRLFAGEDQTSANSVAFDRVREIDVKTPNTPVFHTIPSAGGKNGIGHDDIAFAGGNLQAIVDGVGGTRRLLTWHAARGTPAETDLGQSAGCRIAYSKQDGGWSLVTYLDKYVGRAWREVGGLEQGEFHPLQILPISIAADRNGEWFYVLEFLSNTITAIPATSSRTQIDETKLETYRVEALSAFLQLFRRFAQFLKDCVCEHLLVNCPDPNGKQVYLADVSFKNGAIYQICNFHRRRYVHTFPTVEYWMSLVPLISYLKMQVERFCCDLKLGEFFENQMPPTDAKKAGPDSFVPPTALLYGMTHLKAVNLKALYSDRSAQLFKVAQYAMEKFSRPAAGAPQTSKTTFGYSGIKVNDALARAREDGIRVANVVETTNVADAALKIVGGVASVRRGEAVDLITDDGVVIGVARSAAPPSLPSIVGKNPERLPTGTAVVHHEELLKLREELKQMRGEIDELKRQRPTPPPIPHGQ